LRTSPHRHCGHSEDDPIHLMLLRVDREFDPGGNSSCIVLLILIFEKTFRVGNPRRRRGRDPVGTLFSLGCGISGPQVFRRGGGRAWPLRNIVLNSRLKRLERIR
jgi:hypothetical protein